MSIKSEVWGKSPKGKEVHKFTMTNAMGASVSVMEWGAICTSIIVPDAGGNLDDVVLGFDTLEPYLGSHGCFGDTPSAATATASAPANSPSTARNTRSP